MEHYTLAFQANVSEKVTGAKHHGVDRDLEDEG